MDSVLRRGFRSPFTAGAVVLLVLRAAVSVYPLWWQGVTIDEPDFMLGGLMVWKERGYWVDVDNPPLLKMLMTLPALAAGVRLPDRVGYAREFSVADHFALGKALLFDVNRPETARWTLYSARAMVLLVSLGLAGAWAVELRRRFPRRPVWIALVALGLFLFDPSLTAFSTLAVLDVPAALLGAVAFFSTVRWARSGGRKRGAGVALLWAAAVAVKFTALILLIITVVYLSGRMLMSARREPALKQRPQPTRPTFRRLAEMGAVFFLALWFVYGLEWGPMADRLEPFYQRRGKTLRDRIAALPKPLQLVTVPLEQPVAMPSFLTGALRIFRAGGIEKPVWLMGEYRPHGSPLFYSAVFVFKTPLSVLMLAVLGAAALAVRWRRAGRRRLRRQGRPATDRWVPVWGVALFAMLVFPSTNNMGYRYLFPALPFVYLLAGDGLEALRRWRGRVRWTVAGILTVAAAGDVWCWGAAWPNGVSFANAAAGGPRSAWYLAADSNVDWGQEVRRLGPLVERLRARGFELYGIVYTPDALDFYGIALPPLDEAAWERLQSPPPPMPVPALEPDGRRVVVVWSATVAALAACGFGPAPPGAREWIAGQMKQENIRPVALSDLPALDPSGPWVYQLGQSYFFRPAAGP
ncbi:MAG: phospholipid carrier-dependent glycosyltransferase [Candidatus Sumerlaeia bacterium]